MINNTSNPEAFKLSGEFASSTMERAYLQFSWPNIKIVARYTLLAMAFMGMTFFIGDILNVKDRPRLYILLALRLAVVSVMVLSAETIYRRQHYFERYQALLLLNQMVIAIAIMAQALIRQIPPVYIGVNTILCTLLYYQFINNRFYLTIAACMFFGLGSVTVCTSYMNFTAPQIIGSITFLIPLNFLGITILRLMNKAKRHEFLALNESVQHNLEKEKLIQKLQTALTEVKTLQGFLPICTKCKKVRDDGGFWEKIEKYIQDRTEAQFTESLCPECTKTIYAGFMPDK